jgi:hypothetical protein
MAGQDAGCTMELPEGLPSVECPEPVEGLLFQGAAARKCGEGSGDEKNNFAEEGFHHFPSAWKIRLIASTMSRVSKTHTSAAT